MLADWERRSDSGEVDEETEKEALADGNGGGGGAFARERCRSPGGATAKWAGAFGRADEGRGGNGTAGLLCVREGRRSCAVAVVEGTTGFGPVGGGGGLGALALTTLLVVAVSSSPCASAVGRISSETVAAATEELKLGADPGAEGGTGLTLVRSVDLRDSSLSGMVLMGRGRRRIGRLYSSELSDSMLGGTEKGSFSNVLGTGSRESGTSGSNSSSTDALLTSNWLSLPRRATVELVVVREK